MNFVQRNACYVDSITNDVDPEPSLIVYFAFLNLDPGFTTEIGENLHLNFVDQKLLCV